ncbi:Adenosine kinase 2 [Orchesella cincta]|uniref:Adenosine kinase n=1 Tax=Orchesella cincta TaxID=48709 RepID=A0A1D2MM51_ORCCI|nr:Adenosine kinase 2 [Orchesella cincta]
MSIEEGTLVGMGNPLLDISAVVDTDFLEKYKLIANNAILATEEHVPLYHDLVENYKVEYIAGGATQNTLRVAQWIIGKPYVTSFMGAVGTDEYSKILEESAKNDGVNVRYQKWEEYPTGTCAVLITDHNRSLCAYLAAADHFTKDHLDKPENFALVEKAKYYYISGFFLTVSPESMLAVAEHAATNNKPFAINLSAPFIPEFFTERLMSVLPYVDILFGNETEAETFAKVLKYDTKDVAEIAKLIVALPKKNAARPRMVVFTQGEGPVIVAQGSKVQEFPVQKLSADKIKDTNGAGDAFVGGFLAQYMQEKPIEECVKCGIWTATEVIQQSGCAFPKDKKYPSS